MERNTLLFFALSFGIMVLWYGVFMPSPERAPPGAPESTPEAARESTPRAASDAGFQNEGAAELAGEAQAARAPDAAPALPERKVVLENALFRAEFSSRGGALESFTLAEYRDSFAPGEPHVEMVTRGERFDRALATPLRGLGLGNLERLDYRVSRPDAHSVVFTRTVDGVTIRKHYRFDPEQPYLFRLRIDLENGTERYLRPGFNTLWPARAPETSGFSEFGLAAYSDGDLEHFIVDPPDMLFGGGGSDEPAEYPDVDWAGAHSRYFLAALAPDNPREARVRFQPVTVEREALLQLKFSELDLPPGARASRSLRVYLGPKLPEVLAAHGAHLDAAIARGWLPSLTRFFERAIVIAYGVVPNYGVAILLITVLVRLLMAPLMARQMKSMKRMSALQPAIREVQKKHPDDREKQSAAMMAVYREHGLSPFSMFSGCLPMLLQLPVFIGFYYALQSGIALRQQPFFGWITDLSQPESLFTIPGLELPVRVLPLLMGLSMFLQQKFTPTTMDPAQARMMLWMMPVMFTFLFYQFASGLVLYWFTSTLLGIAQQWLTNRRAN